MSETTLPPLSYDPRTLPRETARHYISATDQDLQAMLGTLGLSQLDELFRHIPARVRMAAPPALPEELGYEALSYHVVAQSRKNRVPHVAFLSDGLPHYKVPDPVPFVAGLRELLTAYTPYQPERSQGTLMTQWLYQCCLAMLTGFEAINASQYDRATALVEALYTAARLARQRRTHFLLLGSLWPQDLEVVRTLLTGTRLTYDVVPIDPAHGIHLGVDVSARIPGSTGNHLLLSCSDQQEPAHLERLLGLCGETFGAPAPTTTAILPAVSTAYRRQESVGLPSWDGGRVRTLFTASAEQNISPDRTCYPLGSCTMKDNPYINEVAAALPGFAQLHPDAPLADAQGTLEVLYHLQEYFKAITGLPAVTTQPMAGAQGELVGLKMFQAYHRSRGDIHRDVLLIPHSAHGTNPATATMAGFATIQRGAETLAGVVELHAGATGQIDVGHLHQLLTRYRGRLAGIMITNPNTSGVFETHFQEIAALIHAAGGLVYMDGANMNAIAGWVDLGALGVDAVHNNNHKTWSIIHGGGGPGDAIVAVSARLAPFLPGVQVIRTAHGYALERPPQSIGSVPRHFGNMSHRIRAYTYLRALGREGVRRMSAVAVLAARYIHQRLKGHFPTLPAATPDSPPMPEFMITLPEGTFEKLKAAGISRTRAIGPFGKLFLDFGYYAPTVSFPEARGLMIEPTESYTKAELDRFADAIILMLHLVNEQLTILQTVPHFTPVDCIDEVSANKHVVVRARLMTLLHVVPNRIAPDQLAQMPLEAIANAIRAASAAKLALQPHSVTVRKRIVPPPAAAKGKGSRTAQLRSSGTEQGLR